MAAYFAHTCGYPECGERVTTAAKPKDGNYWDHVRGRYGGATFDHDVTDVQTTRTDAAA